MDFTDVQLSDVKYFGMGSGMVSSFLAKLSGNRQSHVDFFQFGDTDITAPRKLECKYNSGKN